MDLENKIDENNVKQILKQLITDLLENKIDRKTASKLIRQRIDQGDIFRLNNELMGNSYWTINALDYEYCTTTDSELLYLKECLEDKREYSDEDKAEFVLDSEEPICKLVPTIQGQEIDLDDFERYTPEKFEYYNGVIFGNKLTASRLIALLMTNLGIETVIKLAPKEVWEEALKNYKNNEQQ